MHIKALQKSTYGHMHEDLVLTGFLWCILSKTDHAGWIPVCHEEAITFHKWKHTSPHKHCICVGFCWLHLESKELKDRKHLPCFLLKGDCQNCRNMDQNRIRILRLIQVIHPVSSCVDIDERLTSRSGSSLWYVICGSGNPHQRLYLLRYPPSPWTHSSHDILGFSCGL